MLNPSVDQSFFWKQPTGIKSIPRGNSLNKLIDGIWNTIIFSINTFEGHDCIRIVIMTILVFQLYSYVHFVLEFFETVIFKHLLSTYLSWIFYYVMQICFGIMMMITSNTSLWCAFDPNVTSQALQLTRFKHVCFHLNHQL